MATKRLLRLEDRVSYRIARSKACVFVREDFSDLGGYDQIGRILRGLVAKQKLVKLGYGLYARTKQSEVLGKPIPSKPISELAIEAMEKLKVKVMPSKMLKAYNQGETTQVPTGRVIGVKDRISRKIGYNGKYVSFERVSG